MQSRYRHCAATMTTWPFVLSLMVLVANDFWLKASHPGPVTGKLSDIAGIAVVTLLALGIRLKPAAVFVATAAAFAWWKSPLSQPLIDAVNAASPVAIGRVVDHGDLFALLVMPLCMGVARQPDRFKLPGEAARPFLRVPLMVVTVFAMVATSRIPAQMVHDIRTFETSAPLERAAIAAALADVARQYGLECNDCAAPESKAQYHGRNMWLTYDFIDDHSLNLRTGAFPHGEKGNRKLDRLALDIKRRLRKITPGLEYTERLDDPLRARSPDQQPVN